MGNNLQGAQGLDPKAILFTTPTISDDLPPLVALTTKPQPADFAFHEDEWSQIEFLPASQLPVAQQLLKEYKLFEKAQRVQHGWRNVYVRKIERVPVISAADPLFRLERILGAKAGPAPILVASGAISGRVAGGFSLPLGGNIVLYGYVQNESISVLGAHLGAKPEDIKLTEAFGKLNVSAGLIAVDWRAQLLLTSLSADGQVAAWRP